MWGGGVCGGLKGVGGMVYRPLGLLLQPQLASRSQLVCPPFIKDEKGGLPSSRMP